MSTATDMSDLRSQRRRWWRDPLTCWARCLPLPARRTEKIPGGSRSYIPGIQSMYDTDMPWVVYHYGRTVDNWWPFWRSVRVLGRAAIECECAVCGAHQRVAAKIPRFGPVNPSGREHAERTRFKLAHLHRDKGHPISWRSPLLNPFANGGLDLDMLAMRLEADLRESGADHASPASGASHSSEASS